MDIMRVVFIVLIFFAIIMIFVQNTDTTFVLDKKADRDEVVTCYAKEDIQRVERFKCRIMLQQLRIQTLSECDCSEEIEDVENMYKEYINNLEETCYYHYNAYLSWVY